MSSYQYLLIRTSFHSQGLLGLARGIFEDTTSLSVMIKKIMLQAQELIPCEMCRVLLVDDNPPGVSISKIIRVLPCSMGLQ